MTMYLLYCGLLVTWVLLLWPAFRLKGGARLWLLAVIATGIAALAHEIRMYLWSHAAIRLDIILISMALGCLYGSAAVLLFVKRWRTAATLLAIVVAGIGGVMTSKWIEVGHESQRLSEVFRESNRLLFNAKFRDPETYERYFGPFTGASASLPIYQCQVDAECHSGPGGSGLHQANDDPRQWEASLKPQVGVPFDIKIIQSESGALALEVREQTVRFTKAPPPVDPAPGPQSLRFLGPFVGVECSGAHAKVRQVWLWEDGTRRYGIGVFSTLVAGRHNGYVRPIAIGEGGREGDAWRFAWQQDGRSGTALIALEGGDAILTLDLDGRDVEDADRAVLKSGAVFHDERIELAPLTAGADWRHWFDTMLVGHFVSGDVPAC
jgi:hypothetical protein